MLATSTILEIRRLLDAGELSQRQIARRLGVSRGVVGAIATGKRGLHGRDPHHEPAPLAPELEPTPTRCPRCGGWVFAPCVYCRTVAYLGRCEGGRPTRPRQDPGRRVA